MPNFARMRPGHGYRSLTAVCLYSQSYSADGHLTRRMLRPKGLRLYRQTGHPCAARRSRVSPRLRAATVQTPGVRRHSGRVHVPGPPRSPRPPPAHAARRSAAGAAPASPLAASPAQGVRGRPEARTAESLTREAARARRPPRVVFRHRFSVGAAWRLAIRRCVASCDDRPGMTAVTS